MVQLMNNFFPEDERALLEKGLIEREQKVRALLSDSWVEDESYTRPEAPSEDESGEQLLCKFLYFLHLIKKVNFLRRGK